MEAKEKILLGGSIPLIIAGLLITLGVINVDRWPSLTVLFPLGITMAGLFMIIHIVEKESNVAVDDQQKSAHDAGTEISREETPAKHGSVLAE